MSSIWTEGLIARLKKLHASGLSSSSIGDLLGLTRNAVIGKVHRLGLNPPSARAPPKSTANTQRHVIARLYRVNSNPNTAAQFKVIDTAAYKIRCVEIKCEVPILDVTGCRYTDGDGPFLFCNGPQREGSSYCEPHFWLCRAEPRPKRDRVFARDAA